jgi:hypothetical protein
MFTVPAAASLVTLALLGYAMLRDGLGIKWRCRSLTVLDQTQGLATAWARHSYFAGLPPTGGLTFSRNTAVYPLQFEPPARYVNTGPTRRIEWTDQQRLTAGYLPSRTTTQLMTMRSGECSARLEVRESGEAGVPPLIASQLDAKIMALILRDSEGNHWQLMDGTNELALMASGADEAQRYFESRLSAGTPAVEIRIESTRSRYGWNEVDTGVAAQPRTAASRMERVLQSLASTGVRDLQPRSYVAIVDRSPFVEAGYATVEELDGIHVIVGRY